MAGLKIFTNLTPKNERLPKVTGLGTNAIRPAKPIRLTNPAVSIRNNARLMRNRIDFLFKTLAFVPLTPRLGPVANRYSRWDHL